MRQTAPPHRRLTVPELEYSLQANLKTKEGSPPPGRDEQFRYINTQVKRFLKRGEPILSIDAKKKERVGAFKNAGRTWRPKGQPYHVERPRAGRTPARKSARRCSSAAAPGAAAAWAVSVSLLKAPLGKVDTVAAQALQEYREPAVRAEVVVAGDRVGDPEPLTHDEAQGIAQRVGLVRVAADEGYGLVLVVHDVGFGRAALRVTSAARRP